MFNLYSILQYNPNLFDNIDLPDVMVKDDVVNEILWHGGELQPRISDPDFLQVTIEHWFKIRKYNFQKLWDTTQLDYNPIENYDRYSMQERLVTEKEELSKDTSIINTASGGTNTTETSSNNLEGSTTKNEERKVSAFNSNEYSPDWTDNQTDEHSENNTGNVTTEFSDTRKHEESHTGTDTRDRDNKDIYNEHTHGNIGVTTSQQMIEAERTVVKFNLYEFIAQEFCRDNMIMVF